MSVSCDPGNYGEGSSYKVILKNSEKPTSLHPLQSGIGNERVKEIFSHVTLGY